MLEATASFSAKFANFCSSIRFFSSSLRPALVDLTNLVVSISKLELDLHQESAVFFKLFRLRTVFTKAPFRLEVSKCLNVFCLQNTFHSFRNSAAVPAEKPMYSMYREHVQVVLDQIQFEQKGKAFSK